MFVVSSNSIQQAVSGALALPAAYSCMPTIVARQGGFGERPMTGRREALVHSNYPAGPKYREGAKLTRQTRGYAELPVASSFSRPARPASFGEGKAALSLEQGFRRVVSNSDHLGKSQAITPTLAHEALSTRDASRSLAFGTAHCGLAQADQGPGIRLARHPSPRYKRALEQGAHLIRRAGRIIAHRKAQLGDQGELTACGTATARRLAAWTFAPETLQ